MSQYAENIRTPYGVIHYGPVCKDDYRNFVVYNQEGDHTVFWLQRPAMRAFWAAEVRYAKMLGWTKKRIDANDGHGRAIYVLPGTNRTCATQVRLYRLDPKRFAHPAVTGHTRGLAIDVDGRQPNQAKIRKALLAEGWKQTRPVEEPWHYSYHVTI